MEKSKKKQVSVRLCEQQHNRFEREADKRGLFVSDIVKEKLNLAEKQVETKEMLTSLLNHIIKDTFVITSTVAGLDPDEKETAKLSIEKQLRRRIK